MILLRKLRKEIGMSARQLEKKVGISDSSILNIENRYCSTNTTNLKKLADFFNIENPLDLLNDVEEILILKKCLNQRCLLNKNCYCQSEKVINGSLCQNQNEISNKQTEIKLNSTQFLFIDQ